MALETELAIPFFGYKFHISIDWKWKATNTITSDGARLGKGLLDRSNTASDVWTNTVYRSKANTGKSVIRSRVEHVLIDQKLLKGLFIRTVSITRAIIRMGLANIIYNMRHFLFLEQISIAAYKSRVDPPLRTRCRAKVIIQNQQYPLTCSPKSVHNDFSQWFFNSFTFLAATQFVDTILGLN